MTMVAAAVLVVAHPQSEGKYAAVPMRNDGANGVQNAWSPGKNYVPLMEQVGSPAPVTARSADLPSPLRRENIIARFAHALGTNVYEGRVSGKRLGYFRSDVEDVRIKNANDIEVTAHEVAHLMDHRIPEIKRTYLSDPELASELKDVSYDKSNV
ncbi:MAG: hypothetical protein HY849_07280 [Nitrosomonadales bacterium]|nr:hypothetical protein [Nitrosomonadales bacterium]